MAMPEARCLLLLGYNHAAPSGMGCSFSKGLTPPAVPQVPGAGPLRAGCSHPAPRSRFTAQLCHPFLPSSEHLRSACCGQADGLPSGGQAPFGKSGSPREVRIPSKSQQQFCKHDLSRAELAAPPCGCPVPCTRSLLPAKSCARF